MIKAFVTLLLVAFSPIAIARTIPNDVENPVSPPPSGDVISTLDIRKLTSGGGDWHVQRVNMLKSRITQFNGEDVVYCWHDKGSGTSSAPKGREGGFKFTAVPDGMDQDAIAFSWDVYYPPEFDLERGGKYGGVFVGHGVASGGRKSSTGSSSRVMWKKNNGAIAYSYPPEGAKSLNNDMNGCGRTGCAPVNFPDNSIKIGQWNTITVGTKLNTFNGSTANSDGEVYVIVNGLRKEVGGILWTTSPSRKISSFVWNTFFGGPGTSPKSQFCYYKNFRMLKY